MDWEAAAAQQPPKQHSRVPSVPNGLADSQVQSCLLPRNASLVEVGNFHLYYEPTEPKLHVYKVLRFQRAAKDGDKPVKSVWGTLLSDESSDTASEYAAVTVVCQRWVLSRERR